MKMNGSSSAQGERLRIPKILLVGDAGVGKSSLLSRFALDSFDDRYIFTIGVEFTVKTIQLDGQNVRSDFWDTAGQERFRSITNAFFRASYGIIIVYDVTNQKSFKNLEAWLERINAVLNAAAVDKLIIGNKCDLTTERVVEYNTAKEFADKHGIPLIETSAKTSINVNQAFVQLITACKHRMSEQYLQNNQNIQLNRGSQLQRIRDCC